MTRPLASIYARFAGQLIDTLIALAIGALTHSVVQFLQLHEVLAVVGGVGYMLVCDALPGGRSLGKRVMRTWVVHVDTDEPCTLAQSLVRNLPELILGVIDAAFIVGKQRRRLGDRLARTRVVSAPPASQAEGSERQALG